MHTITRMTPEVFLILLQKKTSFIDWNVFFSDQDLTAIGIQKPNHRKKLKAEMALLQIPDGLPDFKPVRKNTWHD